MFTNRDNNNFYENISLELLNDYEKRSGLFDSCDLDLIAPILSSADTILEIGAGTGRILRNLVARKLKANIIAIERSERLFKLLENEFSENLVLIKADIMDVEVSDKFDVILWMWSGFSDFSPKEQELLVKKLYSMLHKTGSLVIDTTRADVTPGNATNENGRFYQINTENVSISTYVPSEEEMEHYAKKAGFSGVKIQHYATATTRPRTLYELIKH